MSSCRTIDPLVTPYVDGELGQSERTLVDRHIHACIRCRSRVESEQAVHQLLHERKAAICADHAPTTLRSQCAWLASHAGRGAEQAQAVARATPSVPMRRTWRDRLAPLAAAAVLMVVVGGAFLYQATKTSSRIMAAQLAADHMKCFAMNAVLDTQQSDETVQSSMASGFGWTMRLPADAAREGLELVGSRPCFYGEGKIAHIMYRHNGRPLSLFMLPRSARSEEIVEAFGHECAIWSSGDRTLVLVGREDRSDLLRLAAYIHTALR